MRTQSVGRGRFSVVITPPFLGGVFTQTQGASITCNFEIELVGKLASYRHGTIDPSTRSE